MMTKWLWIASAPILVGSFGGPFCRTAQAQSSRSSRFDVRLQILQNADVRVTEELTLEGGSPASSNIERRYPLVRRNQRGGQWNVQYRDIEVQVDGIPHEVKTIERDETLTVSIQGVPTAADANAHKLVIRYLTSNQVRRVGGADELTRVIEWPTPVDTATITISAPPDAPLERATLTAFTDTTPTTTSCDCTIKREQGQLIIETTKRFEKGQYLSLTFDLPSGYLSRDVRQQLQSFEVDRAVAGWGMFVGSVCSYYAIVFAFLLLGFGKKVLDPVWYKQRYFILISTSIAALSLLALPIVKQPYVAMPGFFGGVVLATLMEGSVHGPTENWLWIPLAALVNFGFYYVTTILLFRIGRNVLASLYRN